LQQFKKVNEQALTVFSRQFATMINAGLAMVRCLDILSEQTEDKKLQQTLYKSEKM
jgi:type IV pilus assembly protein PilC